MMKKSRDLLILLQWGNSDKNYYIRFKQGREKGGKEKDKHGEYYSDSVSAITDSSLYIHSFTFLVQPL